MANSLGYTDYTYQVQVRIGSDDGDIAAYITSEGGEIGSPIVGGTDEDIAQSVGQIIIAEARHEEHGNPVEDYLPNQTIPDMRQYQGNCGIATVNAANEHKIALMRAIYRAIEPADKLGAYLNGQSMELTFRSIIAHLQRSMEVKRD